MKVNSVFDVIGPVMVGPSSSHTAGAVRIGLVAYQLLGEPPTDATILLHGSFADTYRGHGTDKAIVAGLLGLNTDDERIITAFELAAEHGMRFRIDRIDLGEGYHMNTTKLRVQGRANAIELVGSSIGGGNVVIVEINGFKTELSGDYNTLIIFHQDKHGVAAHVLAALSRCGVNVAFMRLSRKAKGQDAFMAIEVDYTVPSALLQELAAFPEITYVRLMAAISPAGGA
jgi:L-serine dehydratase